MITKLKVLRLPMLVAPLALMAGTASAGGLAEPVETVTPTPVIAMPVMPSTDWSGFYAGAQLGYADIEFDEDVDEEPEFSGAIYGVHAGYMYDIGSVVLGAEFDYDLTSIEETIDGSDSSLTIEVDSIMRVKARIGYDAGSFLPYVTGGVVRTTLSSDSEPDEIEADGDFYGIGGAYRFNDNVLIGVEVLQHKFYEGDVEPGDGFDATSATARVSFLF
jgi:opacity protein-like surface antigen